MHPVIVGVGRFTQRDGPVSDAQDPLQMMKTAALRAAEDTGVDANVPASVDVI